MIELGSVIVGVSIMTSVVLIDIALPSSLAGEQAYRLQWIATRNWLCDVLALCGVSIFKQCGMANRIMGWLFAKPVYRKEWQ